MQQLENDLDQTQEALLAANNQLEEKDKALSNVSLDKRKSPAHYTIYPFQSQPSKTFSIRPGCSSAHRNQRTTVAKGMETPLFHSTDDHFFLSPNWLSIWANRPRKTSAICRKKCSRLTTSWTWRSSSSLKLTLS